MHGAAVSKRLTGSDVLEFEGDTDTLHGFILSPGSSHGFLKAQFALICGGFLFLAPP